MHWVSLGTAVMNLEVAHEGQRSAEQATCNSALHENKHLSIPNELARVCKSDIYQFSTVRDNCPTKFRLLIRCGNVQETQSAG